VIDSSGINNWPTCSQDGLFVFGSSRNGNFDIYAQPLAGGPPRQLTDAPLQDIRPRVNAAGTDIVFTSTRDGNYEIYTMRADGSKQTRLTSNPERDDYPCWHPDGRLAWVAERDGRFEIVLAPRE
jgi:TolB protein